MTSNLGARFLEKRGHLGFPAPQGEGIPSKIEDMVRGEVKKAFNPELLNRRDEVILFTSLTDGDQGNAAAAGWKSISATPASSTARSTRKARLQ